MINWAWGPCRVCKSFVFEPNLGVFIGWLGDLEINVAFSLKNVPYTHSALPPGPIYQLLTHLTSLAQPEFPTKSALVGRAVHIGA